jgi:hypothetical protein
MEAPESIGERRPPGRFYPCFIGRASIQLGAKSAAPEKTTPGQANLAGGMLWRRGAAWNAGGYSYFFFFAEAIFNVEVLAPGPLLTTSTV